MYARYAPLCQNIQTNEVMYEIIFQYIGLSRVEYRKGC